jgi:LmbE family N-acetylglucosaminyl deacetylase
MPGGHPDDPESGCGGTLAALRKLGHDITIIYLTTGEAGIPGTSHERSAEIRRKKQLMHARYWMLNIFSQVRLMEIQS